MSKYIHRISGSVRLGIVASLLCGTSCVAHNRFKDQPIVWQVADQSPIEEPAERVFFVYREGMDWFFTRRLNRALELRGDDHAHNTNALDEVPDSSWFTNRIGIRDVSPEEAATAASAAGPPLLPLEVVAGKSGGINPGFVAKDAKGRTFVIKFDTKDNPEMQTSINTIVNRLAWTFGYNVANDTVMEFFPEQLSIAEGAELKDEMGDKHPFTPADLKEILRLAPQWPDGHYRSTASEFISGRPLGGWSTEGLREDDGNDLIPHEQRREVRGLRVFAAWLNHTDVKEDNTLDAFIKIKGDAEGRGYVKHFLIDFGESMAGHGAEKGRYEDGYENWIDWNIQARATLALGLWIRPWEHLKETRWPSVGSFGAEHFDPEKWRESYNYWPFAEADASDSYWAAKQVLRFDRELLTRVVAEGQLSQPEAAEYLVDTLIKRRDSIGEAYVQTVTALDYFTIDEQKLCFTDLSVHYGLVTGSMVEILDRDGEVLWDRLVGKNGDLCVPIPAGDGYQFYRLRTRRRLELTPPMQIHFKGGKNARLLGVVRVEH